MNFTVKYTVLFCVMNSLVSLKMSFSMEYSEGCAVYSHMCTTDKEVELNSRWAQGIFSSLPPPTTHFSPNWHNQCSSRVDEVVLCLGHTQQVTMLSKLCTGHILLKLRKPKVYLYVHDQSRAHTQGETNELGKFSITLCLVVSLRALVYCTLLTSNHFSIVHEAKG